MDEDVNSKKQGDYSTQFKNSIIGALGTLIVGFILPGSVLAIVIELFFYIIHTVVIYKISLIIALVVFLFLRYVLKVKLFQKVKGYQLLILVFVVLTILVYRSVQFDLRATDDTPRVAVNFYGSFSLNKDGYLEKNSTDKFVESKFYEELIENSRHHFAFKDSLLILNKKTIPSFLVPVYGLSKVKEHIQKDLKDKFTLGIYILRNVDGEYLQFCIETPLQIVYDDAVFINFEELFSNLSKSQSVSENSLLNYSAAYFIAMFGQSSCSLYRTLQQYNMAHNVLTDSEKIFSESMHKIMNTSDSKIQMQIMNLQRQWSAEMSINKGGIYQDQEDNFSAVKQFIKSLGANSIQPYTTYETWKIEMIEEYDREVRKKSKVKELKTHSAFKYLSEIILDNNDNHDLMELAEKEFAVITTQDSVNPALWFYRGEITKFLPLGKEKIDNLYVKRIPECRKYWEKAKSLDPWFGLLDSKLGTLYIFEAYNDKKRTKELVYKGMQMIKNAEKLNGMIRAK